MREILFRVWNGANYEYDVMVGKFGAFYVNPMNGGLDVDDSASLSPFNTKFSDNVVIEQFTGLKDKNGNKIFEGDIFNLGDKNILYIVLWHDAGFKGKQICSTSYVGLNYWKDRIELIGNIHDNPELLS